MTANTILQNGKIYELTGELRAALPGEFFLSGSIVTLCEEGQRYAYAIVREVTPPAPFPVEYQPARCITGKFVSIDEDGDLEILNRETNESTWVAGECLRDLHERLGRHLEAQG